MMLMEGVVTVVELLSRDPVTLMLMEIFSIRRSAEAAARQTQW